MRHGATLIAALENMSRPAFRIARELSVNSRSGLTVRFLSKKLEMPEEEVEYLIDINGRLFFSDLTKVKLVAEGATAIKRISDGLENYGDIPSLYRRVKALSPHEFRRLEEQVGIDRPVGKKSGAEALVEKYFGTPDSVVEYVASRGFTPLARELFDAVWQSKEGVIPVSKLRAAHKGSEYEVEQALMDLFEGFALFEMFRFDAEDRLVRVAGLLSEIREYRESAAGQQSRKAQLKPLRSVTMSHEPHGLDLSDRICRIVAAIAAKPARLRGDGELFREDRRRLGEICPEDDEPSLTTCLWVARSVGWLAQVDEELRAGELDALIGLSRIERHRILFDWLMTNGAEVATRRVLAGYLDEIKVGAWYSVVEFIRYAMRANAENEQPVLKSTGGHWRYVSPSALSNSEKNLARSLEETLVWLGAVERGAEDDESAFRLTPLGHCLLSGKDSAKVGASFPELKTELIVQPNFDIVVPSHDVDPLLTVPLDQFAERGSTGQATVYHLSKESFTRAVQDGHDGEAFVSFLLNTNRGGSLPTNVMTTLEDWRGGMKRVRLRTIQILESDDPLVIADLMHRRRFNKYFEVIDPHKSVSYAKIDKSELAKALEKDGFVVD